MSFTHFLRRKLGRPSHARSVTTDARTNPSGDSVNAPQRRQASEPVLTMSLPWRTKEPSTNDHSELSLPDPTPILESKAENPTSENGVNATSSPMPLPVAPSGVLVNLAVLPSPDMMPAISPLSDKLTEAWEAVKDDKSGASMSRKLDIVGVSSIP
jgi:hypothetical protein